MDPFRAPLILIIPFFFFLPSCFICFLVLTPLEPRDTATYTTKTKHPPMTLAQLLHSLPGENSGKCPQRSQTTYIQFCYIPYITLSCPKEDIFS